MYESKMSSSSNQYQLSNVEAQRIMAVLDELTQDLRYAFRLTPQSLSSLSEISSVVVGALASNHAYLIVV